MVRIRTYFLVLLGAIFLFFKGDLLIFPIIKPNYCFRQIRTSNYGEIYSGVLKYEEITAKVLYAGDGAEGFIVTQVSEKYPYIAGKDLARCVGLVIYDSTTKVGGILHAGTVRYVRNYWDEFFSEIKEKKVDLRGLKAWIIGGYSGESEKIIQYMRDNLIDIEIVGEDTLGLRTRSFALDLRTGKIFKLILE